MNQLNLKQMKMNKKTSDILGSDTVPSTVEEKLEDGNKEQVCLRELLQSPEFRNPDLRIPVALGKDVHGNPVIRDLSAMPHVLVAGSDGSEKIVCINNILVSFLSQFRPDELRLVLVDTREIDMPFYKKLPHLAVPVVEDPTNAIEVLRWAVDEVGRRYELFSAIGVRTLRDYNALPAEDKLNTPFPDECADDDPTGDEKSPQDGEGPHQDRSMPVHLPYIIIVIGELFDLILENKEELEMLICRFTQKAYGAGMHLIVATQMPTTHIVSGTIKANLPSRIALKVSGQSESRVILDEVGTENLLGGGDMLFMPPSGPSEMVRVRGAFVSDEEITAIVDRCAANDEQNFIQSAVDAMTSEKAGDDEDFTDFSEADVEVDEDLYTRCVKLAATERKVSISLLQRRFTIGYRRAVKLMDMMEERGVISPAEGPRRLRKILIEQP